MRRWSLATAVPTLAVVAAWILCQAVFTLDVATSATVAALAFTVLAAPLGLWAGQAPAAARRPSPAEPKAAAPRITNVGPRNPLFVGRDAVLVALRERLVSGGPVVVQALYGLGGVGKTALAIEYAHRYASAYDVLWWIDAERPNLIGDELAGLARAGEWVRDDADSTAALAEVRRHLARMDRWLLIFDNAQAPEDLAPWLALGNGHVLVTSRHPGWDHLGTKVEVNIFARQESIDFLRTAVRRLSDKDADDIAYRTGDLPLALAQAAGVLAETGMPVPVYLDELRSHADLVMSERPPSSYPVSLAATIRLSVGRLHDEDPAGLQLLRLCALLAPDPVPLDLLFPPPEGLLPSPLASVAASGFEVSACAGRLGRLGLARLSGDGIELHRLTQAVLLDQLDAKEAEDIRAQAEALLVAAAPESTDDPGQWPSWARLLPHVLALKPALAALDEVRQLATDAVGYLLNRGEAAAGRALADDLVDNWHRRFGETDRIALAAAFHLARALRDLDQHDEALDLSEGVLDRYRRLTGSDDPATLAAATGFASSLRALGRAEEALRVDTDTLERKRRLFGEDHPSTLRSANGLASDLRDLGRLAEAEALDRDTLQRKEQVLGVEHPSTLTSAANLAADLRLQGQVREAMALEEETFANARRVLGDGHPTTVACARILAADQRSVGQRKRALELERYAADHTAPAQRRAG